MSFQLTFLFTKKVKQSKKAEMALKLENLRFALQGSTSFIMLIKSLHAKKEQTEKNMIRGKISHHQLQDLLRMAYSSDH